MSKIKIFYSTLLLFLMFLCIGRIDLLAQGLNSSIWLRTNYNWATNLQRNPTKIKDGQTQMPFNKGIGIGLGMRNKIAKRWAIESGLSYQKKGFNSVIQVGKSFEPPEIFGYSELTLSDNYHFIDWTEVIWFKAVNHKSFSISIGAGLGLGALISYKKGSDFWLLTRTSEEHAEYINTKPNSIVPFRYVGIEIGLKDRFKIGFDNKNDIGRFIHAQHFEAKNWVWSLNLNYLIWKDI